MEKVIALLTTIKWGGNYKLRTTFTELIMMNLDFVVIED
jgi:hypothetical protein